MVQEKECQGRVCTNHTQSKLSQQVTTRENKRGLTESRIVREHILGGGVTKKAGVRIDVKE